MRPAGLQQVAQVAIVAPPFARLGSVGALLDGFEMTRAHIRRQYGAVDILPAADRFEVSRVRIVSMDGAPVKTEGSIAVSAEAFPGSADFDVVAIADHARSGEGGLPAARFAAFESWLVRQHERGAIIAACGASLVHILRSGLADRSRLAAAPWLASELRRQWPHAVFDTESRILADGRILSGRGGAADHDLARSLVEAVTSRNTGRWLGAQLGLDTASAGLGHAPGSLLELAQEWLANRYSQPVRIEDLSRALGVSRRTVHRHFVRGLGLSPIDSLQSLRIEAAKRMLERSAFSVERIAALVGYADTAHFRAAFRASTGLSPRKWRLRERQSQM